MLKLRQLKEKQKAQAAAEGHNNSSTPTTSISAAQLRLQKDITELDLPHTIKVQFPDPSNFFTFNLTITPQQGYYRSGHFHFKVDINNNFPIDPPKIKCLNKIYHPNIDLEGNICLNILREDWSPVLSLSQVLMGLNFLLLEPNANDPLNKQAANVLAKDPRQFERNVYNSMRGGYIDSVYFDNVMKK
ncbi:uncharacterized protein SPAPADRAFT_61798 [Spathaspora passalidarum NRRL Y-27907]|uniref:NEDD8-conjugating enzyme UBC12 n=1 Tax=Spathaspora passalidarum (strain NRRL Y-27907 / 11-Y1) TaxID=619300 RepID=G3AR47_SPAPN|nr:uncharacterized protein SPAPADRAFT_61798 [Spathaspora passalidarum NRRL Y-27907]EGW31223.1 hypothetical protein SPAPADRAFT_61798 [Spathaspora passalidarum NRRL Y-27907]